MASSRSSGSSATARRKVRLGCEVPRIWTPPLRKLTRKTTLGYECIDFAEQVLGLQLLPWQKWVLIHALELLPDGSFRFRTVVLLVARQNGKSTLTQVLTLWRMYLDGAKLSIGTAQNLDIAEEVWSGAVEMVEEIPELAEEIAANGGIVKTNGKKALKLRTGERYRVASASRRGGRGLSGDLILLDEIREHQSWDSWGAVTKTTMARHRAQIWATSNAGDATSIVLRHLRKLAHAVLDDPDGINALDELQSLGDDEDAPPDDAMFEDDEDSLGIFEYSAPPDCAVNDRDAWPQANPALGYTITEKALADAMRTDPEWVFRTECLCQWTDGTLEGPFPPGVWDGSLDEGSGLPKAAKVAACVDVSFDRTMTYVAVSGIREDGKVHGEVIAARAGTDWLVPWMKKNRNGKPRHKQFTLGVTLQSSGAPVSSLLDELVEAGVNVVEWKGPDLGRGTGLFYDVVCQDRFRHRKQPALDVAAATAVTKPLGDSWVWHRAKSPTDIAPLVAVTGAVWLVGPKPPTGQHPQMHDWPADVEETPSVLA